MSQLSITNMKRRGFIDNMGSGRYCSGSFYRYHTLPCVIPIIHELGRDCESSVADAICCIDHRQFGRISRMLGGYGMLWSVRLWNGCSTSSPDDVWFSFNVSEIEPVLLSDPGHH
jgi:hypothetical protein